MSGWLVGVFVHAWLAVAFSLLLRAGFRALRTRDSWTPTSLGAHVFLVVGAVWLVLFWRDAGPRHLPRSTVLLAAVHFHFSGFALQSAIAALGRRIVASSGLATGALRGASAAAAVAIAVIAAGNLAAAPSIKAAGVGLMLVCSTALACVEAWGARSLSDKLTRRVLRASALALITGALLAATYAIAELRQAPRMSLVGMAATHGLANALGLALCAYGVLGRSRARRQGGLSDSHPRGDVRDGQAQHGAGDLARFARAEAAPGHQSDAAMAGD